MSLHGAAVGSFFTVPSIRSIALSIWSNKNSLLPWADVTSATDASRDRISGSRPVSARVCLCPMSV